MRTLFNFPSTLILRKPLGLDKPVYYDTEVYWSKSIPYHLFEILHCTQCQCWQGDFLFPWKSSTHIDDSMRYFFTNRYFVHSLLTILDVNSIGIGLACQPSFSENKKTGWRFWRERNSSFITICSCLRRCN